MQAVKKFPNMNRHFAEVNGKPSAVTPAHTNLGLAIDLQGKDGNRQLVVAGIKRADAMSFGQFIAGYEDIVRRARDRNLAAEDVSGVTISLTNPGTIGTVHSVPRLMRGQGAIVGAGAMEYPAEFQGASEERISELGVGKLITLTSTYDHRIIQGAESGDFLRTIHQLLLSDEFFDEIFRELGIPYEPVRWRVDNPDSIVDKNARVIELIAAYRNRGHLMADIDPLRLDKDRFRSHPDLDVQTHGLTLWDLDRVFKVDGFAGCEYKKLRDVLGLLRDAYCRHVGVEYTEILEPEQQRWLQERVEAKDVKPDLAQQKYILRKLNAASVRLTAGHRCAPGRPATVTACRRTVKIATAAAGVDRGEPHTDHRAAGHVGEPSVTKPAGRRRDHVGPTCGRSAMDRDALRVWSWAPRDRRAAAAGLPDRRHDSHRRQQPDRVHHLTAGFPIFGVLHRRGEDDRGADLPCERGGPGGLRVGGAAGDGVPAAVQEGRRHRHAVLPAAWSQRG